MLLPSQKTGCISIYTVPQAINRVLLQSLFLFCLNAFLQIGEVISKTQAHKEKVPQV